MKLSIDKINYKPEFEFYIDCNDLGPFMISLSILHQSWNANLPILNVESKDFEHLELDTWNPRIALCSCPKYCHCLC